jgi:hypothetical protein
MLRFGATLVLCWSVGCAAAATVRVEIADQPIATTSDHYTCACTHRGLRYALFLALVPLLNIWMAASRRLEH